MLFRRCSVGVIPHADDFLKYIYGGEGRLPVLFLCHLQDFSTGYCFFITTSIVFGWIHRPYYPTLCCKWSQFLSEVIQYFLFQEKPSPQRKSSNHDSGQIIVIKRSFSQLQNLQLNQRGEQPQFFLTCLFSHRTPTIQGRARKIRAPVFSAVFPPKVAFLPTKCKLGGRRKSLPLK